MPKYYFQVHDGLNLPDDEGVELPDLDAAVREAVRFAGSLLEGSGNRLQLGGKWSLEVREEASPSAFRIEIYVRSGLAQHSSEASRHRLMSL